MNHPDPCLFFVARQPLGGIGHFFFKFHRHRSVVSTSIHIKRCRCGKGSNVRRLMVVTLFDPRADILNSIRLSSVPLVPATLPRATEASPLIFGIVISFPHIPYATRTRKTGRTPKIRVRKRGLTRTTFVTELEPSKIVWEFGWVASPDQRHMTHSRSYLSRNRPGVS